MRLVPIALGLLLVFVSGLQIPLTVTRPWYNSQPAYTLDTTPANVMHQLLPKVDICCRSLAFAPQRLDSGLALASQLTRLI